VTLDGSTTYGVVNSFPLATKAISGTAWVNLTDSALVTGNVTVFRNMDGDFQLLASGNTPIEGQFSVELLYDATTGGLLPSATVGLGNNFSTATAPTVGLVSNGWHNVTFTADGAQLKLFVDGNLVTSSDYVGDINAPSQPWISVGARLHNDTNQVPPLVLDPINPNMFPGSIDDMGLWTRALTASEVTAVYQAGLNHKSLTTVIDNAPSNPATLSAKASGGKLVISWSPNGGRLESASALLGKATVWTPVGTNNPATNTIAPGSSYFRVVNP